MTTIACSLKHKSMACDSRITGDVIYHADKVRKVGQSLFGVAGNWETCVAFLEWVESGAKEKPTLPDDDTFQAVELCKAGIYLWQRSCIRMPVQERFYACGSGAQGAMVAMSLDLEPKAAIAAVLRFDESTGPPIKSYNL